MTSVYYSSFYPAEDTTGAKGTAAFASVTAASLTVPSSIVPTLADGTGGVYSSSGGFMVVKRSDEVLTATYSVVSRTPSSPTWITINSSTGAYTVTDPSADAASAVLRATVDGVNYDLTYNLVKVKRGVDGTAGTSPILIDLSNDTATVPSNSDGSSPNFTGVSTTVSIFEGTTDVTSSWTITQALSSGLAGTASGTPANRTFTPTGLTVDNGTVTFTATRAGFPNQTAVFSLGKARAGANGSPATVYEIRPNLGVIKRLAAGTFSPAAIVFEAYSTTGTGLPTLYAGRFIIATSTDGTNYTNQYTSGANENSYSYTLTGSITHVRATLYLAGGTTTIVDQEIIPVTVDGTNGINAVSGYLTKEALSIFTYANGSAAADSFTNANGIFRVFNGINELTTTADVTYSIVGTPTNCTVQLNTALNTPVSGQQKGYYRVTALSGDNASAVLRATVTSVTPNVVIDKPLSISRSKGGYEILATLPAAGDARRFEGSVVFLTSDDKLYRFDGTNWVASVPATDLTGQIIGTQITDGAISSPKIATNAVIADKIEAGAVTAAKINVSSLSAINANVGTLTAGIIRNNPASSNNYIINLDDGRQIVVSGSFMKVSGVPFGDGPGTSQFIEWYGPVKLTGGQPDPSLCTAIDAIYYLTNLGGAYFGGSLASGVIRNSAQTTSTISTAFINVGPFSTNGGTKTISLSYSFGSFGGSDAGTVSFSGTTSITVVLEKSTNGGSTWSTIATLTPSETVRSVETYDTGAGSEGSPIFADAWNYGVAGSLTATDNTAAGTMLLRGRITARTLATVSTTSGANPVNILDNATQNITVVSTEG